MKRNRLYISAVLFFLIACSLSAFSSELAEREGGEAFRTERISAWRSVGAVIFVLGGLLAVNAFLRKKQLGGIKAGGNKRIRIMERVPLDQRRSIVLLEADGRRILVGVGADRITPLADLGKEEAAEDWRPELMRGDQNA